MKKPLAIRIDADLLEATRKFARLDNRTITNFVEDALRRRVAEIARLSREPVMAREKAPEA